MVAKGSPMIFQTILNLAGNSPTCDLTLRATGLYFFLVAGKMSIRDASSLFSSLVRNRSCSEEIGLSCETSRMEKEERIRGVSGVAAGAFEVGNFLIDGGV